METVSCRWSKENDLHLENKEQIIFDNWTKPSNTFILWGAVTGQNGKGQRGAGIAGNPWAAARSGEGWAERSTAGMTQPGAGTGTPASHGHPGLCSRAGLQPAPSCSCVTAPRARRAFPPPNTDVSFETVRDKYRIINGKACRLWAKCEGIYPRRLTSPGDFQQNRRGCFADVCCFRRGKEYRFWIPPLSRLSFLFLFSFLNFFSFLFPETFLLVTLSTFLS